MVIGERWREHRGMNGGLGRAVAHYSDADLGEGSQPAAGSDPES